MVRAGETQLVVPIHNEGENVASIGLRSHRAIAIPSALIWMLALGSTTSMFPPGWNFPVRSDRE